MNEPRQPVLAPHADLGNRRAEPALLQFARILWRRRILIGLGSLLPAILVGVMIYLLPLNFTTTFVYERPLNENDYHVLLRRFYSSENLDKIIAQLKSNGAITYAARLEKAETEQALQRLIRFGVTPAYPTRLQTTDPNTSEQIGLFKARLFHVEITGRLKNKMTTVGDVITANVENVLPIYDVRNQLKESMQRLKERAMEIEENRFALTVERQKEKTRLEKLTALGKAAETPADNLVLQFTEVAESREFLPLPYQKRAVQSKIVDIEETLRSDEEMYNYYLALLELNARLLNEIEKNLLTYYTVPQYLDFLQTQLGACEQAELADHLRSLIHKTQNRTLVHTRAGEKPVVYPVAKRLLRRSALVLIVMLMVTAFVAMALEYGPQQRHGGRTVSGTGSAGS